VAGDEPVFVVGRDPFDEGAAQCVLPASLRTAADSGA
jgi:hypothetical protein